MAETERQLVARLGASIRRARTARRWSQATLAEKLDVSVDYVGMLERGERLPSFATLIRAAELLHVTVVGLIGAPEHDPWTSEALELLGALPTSMRDTVIGMLRAAVASAPEVSRAAESRRKRRAP